MLPIVAIVGRPNVGKSTLFNRLTRQRRLAIVEDIPGVTRDRHYDTAKLGRRSVHLVDTGGFEPEAEDCMEAAISAQTALAIDEADLILAMFDARDGLIEGDRQVVEALRRTEKPAIYLANKVDGREMEGLVGEFYALGLERVLAVSARQGVGVPELVEAIERALPGQATEPAPKADASDESGPLEDKPAGDPADPGAPEDEPDPNLIRVALVGRPNAGKSSLLNRLLGEQRAIVSDVPGTTRDPINAKIPYKETTFEVVDTAGLRRKRSVSEGVERYSVIRAMGAVLSADVTCLVVDAAEGVVEQDAKIAALTLDKGKGLVLVMTKSDLLVPLDANRKRLTEEVTDKLRFAPFAPLLFLSSQTGKSVGRLLPTVARIHRACQRRIPTAELNRFLAEVLEHHPPPQHHHRPVRLYYATQVRAGPPTFVLSVNTVDGIAESYRRYLVNALREFFHFEGAPLRLILRKHGDDKPRGRGKRPPPRRRPRGKPAGNRRKGPVRNRRK